MRIIFMGTPDFAVPALKKLAENGHDIVAVYSQPPRKSGRGKKLTPSPVHRQAEAMGLEVRTPVSLKNAEAQDEFAAWNADVAIVAAYGLILPQAILDAVPLGCINIHGSLLPRWRGAAPVQRAILAGDDETGVCIMQMEKGLDTGPVLARQVTPIADKNTGELTEELAQMGADLLCTVLNNIDQYPPQPQPENGVTYAHKIDKAESKIEFTEDADMILRQIQAFCPYPCAWMTYEGQRIRILEAEMADIKLSETAWALAKPGQILDENMAICCGNRQAIRPDIVQRAGKPAMKREEFLRGAALKIGDIFNAE